MAEVMVCASQLGYEVIVAFILAACFQVFALGEATAFQ